MILRLQSGDDFVPQAHGLIVVILFILATLATLAIYSRVADQPGNLGGSSIHPAATRRK